MDRFEELNNSIEILHSLGFSKIATDLYQKVCKAADDVEPVRRLPPQGKGDLGKMFHTSLDKFAKEKGLYGPGLEKYADLLEAIKGKDPLTKLLNSKANFKVLWSKGIEFGVKEIPDKGFFVVARDPSGANWMPISKTPMKKEQAIQDAQKKAPESVLNQLKQALADAKKQTEALFVEVAAKKGLKKRPDQPQPER